MNPENRSIAAPSRLLKIVSWVLQIGVALILGQTLFFKFTGVPETVAMFEILGTEPLGRYGVASLELFAVVLLLIPRTSAIGALVSLGAIAGAIAAHLTKLGISIDADSLGNPAIEPLNGPSLFGMAVAVFLASAAILFIRRRSLPLIGKAFARIETGSPA